jgi:hypothetical protein
VPCLLTLEWGRGRDKVAILCCALDQTEHRKLCTFCVCVFTVCSCEGQPSLDWASCQSPEAEAPGALPFLFGGGRKMDGAKGTPSAEGTRPWALDSMYFSKFDYMRKFDLLNCQDAPEPGPTPEPPSSAATGKNSKKGLLGTSVVSRAPRAAHYYTDWTAPAPSGPELRLYVASAEAQANPLTAKLRCLASSYSR